MDTDNSNASNSNSNSNSNNSMNILHHPNHPASSPTIEKPHHLSQSLREKFRAMRHNRQKHRRRISWGTTDEHTAKSRRAIDIFLRRLGQAVGEDLHLSPEGICYFKYKKFIVVVEVPEDNGGFFYIYTMVCRLIGPADNRFAVMEEAMHLNYMQQGTRGCCLGIEADEVNLCYSALVNSMNKDTFVSCVEDFMHTAEELNQKLDAAKSRIQ